MSEHAHLTTMPTPWLQKHYLDLHARNAMLTKVIDDSAGVVDSDKFNKIMEDQINCFNEQLAAGNILLNRGDAIPVVNHNIVIE